MAHAKPPRLRKQHERFALAYSASLNLYKAALEAGYSETTARAQGARLLGNVGVQEAVEHYAAERLHRMDIDADRVLKEIARLAFHDPRKLFDEDGHLLPVSQWDDDTAAAVAGIEVVKLFEGKGPQRTAIGTLTKVRFWSKNTSLDQLGRHLTLFGKQDEQGRTISELLRAVLLELSQRQPDTEPRAIEAEWQPVDPAPAPTRLPPPPAPELDPPAPW
jgi:phage terminase small subunit